MFRYFVIGFYVGFATVGIFVYWYIFDTHDGHTLVTWNQLRNWSECPNWTDFHPKPFDGINFDEHPCTYFSSGKVKASTLSLSVLVFIEMFNAFNSLSENGSLLTVPPWVNPWLILAVFVSVFLHCVIVYVPFYNSIFGITALNTHDWLMVLSFSLPVIFIDEVNKFFGWIYNAK